MDADWVSFFVEVALAARPYVEWIDRDVHTDPSRINEAFGSWRNRLMAPQEAMYWPSKLPVSAMDQFWGFDKVSDGEDCGRALERVLMAESVPTLLSLLDWETLIAAIRDPGTNPSLIQMRPRERALALLLADRGPSEELDQLLHQLERSDPDDIVVAWIRERIVAGPPAG